MVPFLLSLLSEPASAASFSVVGSLVREATLEPGGSVEGWLEVQSHADEPQSLVVSLRDYTSEADGSNEYGAPGSVARSNTAWISFTPRQLTLEPHETQRVHYRVDVPGEEDRDGTFWGLLMIEPAVPEPGAVADGTPRVAIRTVVRYAVQIVTHVGTPAGGELAFERGQLSGEPGAASLAVDVRNVGEWRLAPRVWVELFDPDGGLVGRFEAKGRPGLFPGSSARYVLDLSGVGRGAYTAFTVADAGQEAVFGTEYPLDLR
jgi:hypothetical protein